MPPSRRPFSWRTWWRYNKGGDKYLEHAFKIFPEENVAAQVYTKKARGSPRAYAWDIRFRRRTDLGDLGVSGNPIYSGYAMDPEEAKKAAEEAVRQMEWPDIKDFMELSPGAEMPAADYYLESEYPPTGYHLQDVPRKSDFPEEDLV